jgi:hypothetical protein
MVTTVNLAIVASDNPGQEVCTETDTYSLYLCHSHREIASDQIHDSE